MSQDDLIRFVTGNRHPPYGYRSGILQAAFAICREHGLAAADRAELQGHLDWFNDHLERPERLAASRRAHGRETGLSWIRATAREHIAHLRRVAALVEAAGIAIEELRTVRPGYVLYEDDNQVVALPFIDTPT
jgi:hypothetical protein